MILGRSTSTNGTRIVRMWDRVEVGGGPKDSPQTPLDVKGEIRGKVWNSGTYTVDWNDPKKRDIAMTRSDHSVCFLTLIRGGWAGIGEQVWVEANGDGRWHLKVIQGGAGRDVMGQAVCIGAPDESW
jgi:hypothetical protein